ncbi:MAG: hypothetical protein IPJ60_01680 [Sphingobacteriaceae bacterium]|nr:hypothetical protein [Sphingobacteriaceae bacterium]
MTEETKKQLMQSLHKLAEHYQIPNATLVSFKKRNLLLELINTKNEDAFGLINDFIESSMILDRIQNDTEKQAKKPEHWNEEVETAKKVVNFTKEKLNAFFKSEGIK